MWESIDKGLERKQKLQAEDERLKSARAEMARRDEQRAAKLQHQLYERFAAAIGDLLGAGLISREKIGQLNAEQQHFLVLIHGLCDEMKGDLLGIIDFGVATERGSMNAKAALGGAAIGAALQGNWSSVAFGLASAGMGKVKEDLLRVKQLEFQKKWIHKFVDFNAAELDAFALLFQYRYPLLAEFFSHL